MNNQPPLLSHIQRPRKVAIVEDDPDSCSYFRNVIDHAPGYACVGAFHTKAHAESKIPLLAPEVVTLDLSLYGVGTGKEFHLLKLLKAKLPKTRFIVITVHDDPCVLWRAIESGANGFLAKPVSPHALVLALDEVFNGGAVISPTVAARLLSHFALHGEAKASWNLTATETLALELTARGLDRKEICHLMGVKPSTLRTHFIHIYDKMQVHSESAAVAKFLGNPPFLPG